MLSHRIILHLLACFFLLLRVTPAWANQDHVPAYDLSPGTASDLGGSWLFFPNHFLDERDLQSVDALIPQAIRVNLPGPTDPPMNFPRWGTLLIQLHGLDAIKHKLGIRFRADTAFRMLVMESIPGASLQEVLVQGKVSDNPNQSIPQIADRIGLFPALNSTSAYLVVYISGWHYHAWNVWRSPVIDSHEILSRKLSITLLSDIFISGMLSIMFLYFASLYFYRRNDYAALWMTAMIIAVLTRQIGIGGPFLGFAFLEPNLGIYALVRKMEYGSLSWIGFTGLGFVVASFRFKVPRYFLLADGLIALLLSGYCILAPVKAIAGFIHFTNAYIVIHALLGIFLSVYAVRARKVGSMPMLVGLVFLLLAIMHDISVVVGWNTLFSMPMGSYGVVALLFCQGQILAVQFSRTFKDSIHTLRQLKKVVYMHQLELIKAGQQLESTMPTQQSSACVLSFDIIDSSKIRHIKSKEFFRRFFERCNEEITAGYNGVDLKAQAYRIKEMGDGFLCSVGYPFASLTTNPANEAVDLARKFTEILREESAAFHMTKPLACGIGIALDDITGFYPATGAKEYDLYGPAIILATRYESMRKTLFSDMKDRSVIIIQEIIFQSLDPVYRQAFKKIDLKEEGIVVRDDPAATVLYYQFIDAAVLADAHASPLSQAV